MEKTYHLRCKHCGANFTGTAPGLGFCSEYCREIGTEQRLRAYYDKQKQERRRKVHEYSCQKCGRRIGVVGVGGSSGRKYCDGCLENHMGKYGLRVLSQRRDLPERVIYPGK